MLGRHLTGVWRGLRGGRLLLGADADTEEKCGAGAHDRQFPEIASNHVGLLEKKSAIH
jgi:hypothetical protein